MRFILGFIFFGLLFYIIYLYFPEAFQTLVAWAGKVYTFFYNLIVGLVEKINSWSAGPAPQVPPVHPVTPEVPKQIAHFFDIF